MASITQKINSVNGGISQQPDELKIPGQVVTAKNVLPDITHGLQKRPGSILIGSIRSNADTGLHSADNGKWFSYYRDEDEQYIGQIKRNGHVNLWKCSDGESMTVVPDSTTQTQLFTYLSLTADDDIQTLSLNDFTFITNREKPTAMLTGTSNLEPVRPPEAFIELKQIKYASQYGINLYDLDGTNPAHYSTVTTATRIEVTREVDSSNSCRPPTGSGSDYATGTDPNMTSITLRGQFPPIGTTLVENGTPVYSDAAGRGFEPGTHTFTGMCNNQGNYSDSSHKDLDSYCPNVDTRIFKVSHTTDNSITEQLADSNNSSRNYTVTPNGGNAADRKDLFLRITTTGQSVAQGQSSAPEYHCRYTTTHDLLHGGEGWQVGDYVDVWMKNARYRVTIKEVSTMSIQANLGLIRPSPTSFDNETTVTAESILGSIKSKIDTTFFTVTQIGTGLYITRNTSHADATKVFNISTSQGELLNVLTNEVQDVADLPQQCKHGYVVKVKNSAADEDDYYLRFIGRQTATGQYLDGTGVWEECAKPGRQISFDKSTMPVQLVRRFDDASGTITGTANEKYFTLEQVNYEDCLVGDSLTAPKPSFMSTVAGTDDDTVTSTKTINKMVFFRNRLVFLSDENVIMSRPGDFFNFWPKSAIAASAEDNIDISASSEYPAILFDGIQVNSGLLLFTKNQQFMLTTDSDVLSPLTAKINAMSTYNFNHKTNPISLGTTVTFLDNAGKYTRMFEMASVLREGEPVILEQSVVISKLFPKNINLIANSRENSFVVFAEKDKNKIYGFRYFTSGEKRVMQSWVTWELSGNIQHLCMLDDALFVVVRNGTDPNINDVIQRINLKQNIDGTNVTDNNKTYKVYMDNMTGVVSTTGTYSYSTDKTTFPKPNGFDSDKQLAAYDIDVGDDIGQYAKVTVNNAGNLEIQGDWSGHVLNINVTNQGTGYTTAPVVNISGGNGSGAQATTNIADGKVTSITVTREGSNYTTIPTISIGAVWQTSRDYTVGQQVTNNGQVYTCSTAGTSASSGGPSGSGTNITDNTVTWDYAGNQATATAIIDDTQFLLGYLYDMEIEFPKFYQTQNTGTNTIADVQSNLVIHRIKFNFGPLGLYETNVKRLGKNDYNEIFEPVYADNYVEGELAIDAEHEVTLPIYERNTNYTLTLKSSHPTPATLYSLAWEGDYTSKNYRRV